MPETFLGQGKPLLEWNEIKGDNKGEGNLKVRIGSCKGKGGGTTQKFFENCSVLVESKLVSSPLVCDVRLVLIMQISNFPSK